MNAVTADARAKTHFVIVDAVGVCENDKTDSQPLERKRSVGFDKLIMSVAMGDHHEDTLTSLAGRLARLDREIDAKDRQQIEAAADDKSLKHIINQLLDAVDPDQQVEKAKALFQTEAPSEKQIQQASRELAKAACLPFDSPPLRDTLIEIKKRNEQIIDTVSKDQVLFAGFDEQAREKAATLVDTFKKFIDENKDELTAVQMIYSKPFAQRRLTYEAIKQLAEAIRKPPYHLTPEALWLAYQHLEQAKVKGAGPQKLLTNIVSLLRFALGQSEVLEPFADVVDRRFRAWLQQQVKAGREFTPEQMEWLEMIKTHVAASVHIEMEDFDDTPFYGKGGRLKAHELFGENLNAVLEELNEVLTL